MDERKRWNPARHRLAALLLTGAGVYAFLAYLTPLFSPILTAMLFVTIFGPLLQNMQRRFHIHRQVGAVILLLFACAAVGVTAWILFSWLVGSAPEWIGRLDLLERDLSGWIGRICGLVGEALGIDSGYLEKQLLGGLKRGIDYFRLDGFTAMLSGSLRYIRGAALFGGFLITFLIASVLLARDYDRILNGMLERQEWHIFLEVVCGIIRYIATYVKAQLILMSAVGALAAGGLALAGVRQGVLWGLAAGLLDALPFVGTGIVLIPLALGQFLGGAYGRGAVCLALYGGCVLLRELWEPRLIGKRLGVPPIAVLAAVYAGIRLFGVWGIIKGPLGFVIVYETYVSLTKNGEGSAPP